MKKEQEHDLIAKVGSFAARHGMLCRRMRIVAGVSGGVDSVCLLHVLSQIAPEYDLRLHVVHLNHMLRPEAADDAAFVRQLARRLGLPVTIGYARVGAIARRLGIGIEEAGRLARYRLLEQVASRTRARRIAVGHHAGDQVETVLFNIMRGTGPGGLAGMRPRRGALIRPLLCASREEIVDYCRAAGLEWRTDPSNLSLEFLRNRIRHRLLPLLRKEFNPRIDQAVLRLAEIAGEEDRWLRRHAEVLLRWLSVGAPGMATGAARRGKRLAAAEVRLDLPAFLRQPVTLRRRLLLAAVRRSGGSLRHLGYQNVSDCLDFLSRGVRGGTVQLPGGVRVNKDSACFTVAVESAAPNKSDQQEFIPVPLPVPGKTLLPGLGLAIRARVIDTTPDGSSSFATPLLQGRNIMANGVENHAISYDLRSGRREGHRFPVRPPGTGAEMKMKGIECWTACFDYDRLEASLTVRTRRDGDRLRPFGMQGAKKLKKLLGELGVPAGDRDRIALVVSGDEIIWVAGYRRAQAAPVSTQTRHMLILEVERL